MKNTNKNKSKEKNTPKKYVARPNSIVSQKEVDIIAPYLHEHLFPDGNFDREAIIEDAKRSKSPLHKHFNWDDTSAAHAHRLSQAQKLITSFYCVTSEGYEVPSVVSVRIVDSPNRNYMATTKAIQSPDLCEQLLQQAVQGLATWKKRYDMFIRLPEFSKLSKEIDIIVEIHNKNQNSLVSKRKGKKHGKS